MSDIKYLAKNTVLIGTSKITSHVIAFLMLPIYTVFLTTSEYGFVDIFLTYAVLLSPILMLNLQAAMFRFLIEARNDEQRQRAIVTNSLDILLIPFGGLCIMSILLGSFMGTYVDILLALAIYFFSYMVADLMGQIARGFGQNTLFAVSVIAQGALTAGLGFLFLVVYKAGIPGIFWSFAIGCLLPALYLVCKLRVWNFVSPGMRNTAIKKELLSYSLPLVPNNISWWVFNASDRTIIFFIISATANGIYAVSNKFSGILYNLWGIFYLPLTESVSLVIHKDNRDEFLTKVFSATIRGFAALTATGIILTGLLFPYIIGESFNEARQYVPVLMLAGFFNCIVGFYSTIYIAKKLTKEVMRASILAAIINLVVILSLIFSIGVWAAAVSTLVAFAVTAIHRHYDIKGRGINISIKSYELLSIAIMIAVCFICFYINSKLAGWLGLILIVASSFYLNRDTLRYFSALLLRSRR